MWQVKRTSSASEWSVLLLALIGSAMVPAPAVLYIWSCYPESVKSMTIILLLVICRSWLPNMWKGWIVPAKSWDCWFESPDFLNRVVHTLDGPVVNCCKQMTVADLFDNSCLVRTVNRATISSKFLCVWMHLKQHGLSYFGVNLRQLWPNNHSQVPLPLLTSSAFSN